MKTTYDKLGPKRAVNLSLNKDLVALARQHTDNLSAEVEVLLAEFVARRQQEHDAHAESLRRCAETANEWLDRYGSLSDEFSTL